MLEADGISGEVDKNAEGLDTAVEGSRIVRHQSGARSEHPDWKAVGSVVVNYTIHNASEWSIDQLAPYMSQILAEMGRLAKRFPKDVTTAALFQEVLAGKRTLWLVLEGETFVSIAMTSIRTIDATGTRLATLNDLSGSGVNAYAAELCSALEQWAAKNNAEPEIYGRKGWEPLLDQFGYKPHAVLYRKVK